MATELTIAERRRRQGVSLEKKLRETMVAQGPGPAMRPLLKLRRLWKRLPVPSPLRGAATSLLYRWSGRVRHHVLAQDGRGEADLAPLVKTAISPGDLVISGFLSDVSGIGRAGRLSVEVLRRAGLDVRPHDLRRDPSDWPGQVSGGVWLAHCNAPEAAEFLLASHAARRRYRIGYWAWELPELPTHWALIAGLFHELWAPSAFVAEAMAHSTRELGVPIRVVPHPHPDVSTIRADPARFDLDPRKFTFLAMYDVRSSATRKNPVGAMRAFQMAFDRDRGDVELVVKVVSAGDSRGCLSELRSLAYGWPNIRILLETLTDEATGALIASVDAFVSLHRSEGFGLSIAQAMALARPVITTGWSGNMQFCGDGALLVPYEMVPVVDAAAIYHETDQLWAEPDLGAAARHMIELVGSREHARDLGERCRQTVRERLPDGYEIAHLDAWLSKGPGR